VRHAQHDLVDAVLGGAIDGERQQRIKLSEPDSEKLLAPTNFFWMNSSKIEASVSLVKMRSCSARESWMRFSEPSIRSCSQFFTFRSSMCMNCTPIERQ
jgi:hypothetical protein